MRKHRVALIITIVLGALSVAVSYPSLAGSDPKEAPWTSSPSAASPLPTMLLSNQSLQPLAQYASAVIAAQQAQAAAAAQAAASALALKEAASSSIPTASGPSSPPSTTSAAAGTCGAEDSIAPGPAAAAEAAGVPCAWVPTAVCEESGRDDATWGFFGIQSWYGFDGIGDPSSGAGAGSAPLDQQLAWESAHGQGPPDAPGQCHGY